MKASLFDYELPKDLIAFHPSARRDESRLLVLDPNTGGTTHALARDLPDLLPPGALMVANDTKVIPARLRAKRPTGGGVEILFVRELEAGESYCRWVVLARANKPVRVGDSIVLSDGLEAKVEERKERGRAHLYIPAGTRQVRTLMDERGEIPLPPYIRRAPTDEDKERYQTVYAAEEGSVAAPTAGLHFTPELMDRLKGGGVGFCSVTLHVGPGTFRPITADDLEDHEMDEEHYHISEGTVRRIEESKGKTPVMAVGTTVVRTLEGCCQEHGRLVPGGGSTAMFISPPFDFKVVDGLVTNFHLPKSTLLCLVSALAGRENVLAAYREAVAMRYRFYSYGDAMLILPRKP